MSSRGQFRKLYKLLILKIGMVNSIFLQVYGDNPKLRVLDFLITFQDYDYSMKDIAKQAEVGYTTLKEFWPEFVKRNIVKKTRIIGNAKMFKLNTENPEVKQFMKFYWLVIDRETDKILEKNNREKSIMAIKSR